MDQIKVTNAQTVDKTLVRNVKYSFKMSKNKTHTYKIAESGSVTIYSRATSGSGVQCVDLFLQAGAIPTSKNYYLRKYIGSYSGTFWSFTKGVTCNWYMRADWTPTSTQTDCTLEVWYTYQGAAHCCQTPCVISGADRNKKYSWILITTLFLIKAFL